MLNYSHNYDPMLYQRTHRIQIITKKTDGQAHLIHLNYLYTTSHLLRPKYEAI
jgi:hypothetical protein